MAAIVTTTSSNRTSLDAARAARAKRDEVAAAPEPEAREPHEREALDDDADDLYDNVACTD